MQGKVYGIGVGPGDKELITLKAVNILKTIDCVVCPEANKGKGSIAYNIAKEYLSENVEKIFLSFPMSHDKEFLQNKWKENALIIKKYVDDNKKVAFLTLGDPTLFSTYMYVVPLLVQLNIEVITIPGITSFCASAAAINQPLTLWAEDLAIVPLKKGCKTAITALDNYNNVVIMKPSHDSKTLAKELLKRGLENNFTLVCKCSTNQQEIITDINSLLKNDVPYLSTMIVKKLK